MSLECKNMVIQGSSKTGMYFRPCGLCTNCRINDTRAWYVRSRFELKKSERPYQYFLTLTYNDESLPDDKLCNKSDLKRFLNHLNTAYGLTLRYYACADYGSINNRAHYHAILLSTRRILPEWVDKVWKKGFSLLKPLNDKTLRYTLRYTLKKRALPEGDRPFFRLISKGWGNNVKDYYCGQDYFVFDGKKYGISRYLRQKLGLEKKEVEKYKNYVNLMLRSEYERIGTIEGAIDDAIKYRQILRRMK